MEQTGQDRVTDTVFCPEVDQVQIAFMNLLPRGRAWGTRESLSQDTGSIIRKFVKALSNSWMHLEDAMCQSFNEWYCSTAEYDVDLWMLDYGIPDECDLYNMDVCSKVGAIHGVSAGELTALLEKSGYNCEARWLTGKDQEFPGVRSTLRIIIDPSLSPSVQNTMRVPFPLGRRLGIADLNQIQCMLERYIPLHCAVNSSVSGEFNPTDLGSNLVAWWNADDTSDGNVTTWTDRVGGIVLSPVNINNPVSAVDASGKRFVTLNGTNMALYANAGISAPGGDTTSSSLLIRYDGISTDPDMRIASIGTPSGANARTMRRLNGNILQSSTQGVSASTPHFLDPSSLYANIAGLTSASGIGLRNLGKQQATSGPIAGLNTTGSVLVYGADSNTGTPIEWFKGSYRHIFIVRNMTTHDYMRLEAWEAWDVGQQGYLLPSDHPYSNMRP